MATGEFVIPDIGSFNEVEVIDVLVKPGDRVSVETPLLTLETEKAVLDVPSPVNGVIEKLLVQKGSRVSTGTPMAVIAEGDHAGLVVETAIPTPESVATSSSPIVEEGIARANASPSVRALARQRGVDLSSILPTGVSGRLSHNDVIASESAVISSAARTVASDGAVVPTRSAALPAIPSVDFANFGEVEVKPLSRIKRISGARLHSSWANLPHVTHFDEADITELEATRARMNDAPGKERVKLSTLAFVLRAVARTLTQFPQFNASLDASGESLIFKRYVHLGFAADTPNGLLVPVIRDAGKKDVYEIAAGLISLSEKARGGTLAGTEMQGGSFTVSSLGGIGGMAFTPIINAPEVAILGVSRSVMKQVWQENGEFSTRLMLPFSLSYDHRVIDGAEGARFAGELAAQLGNVSGLLEAAL